jgi:hypothetical protein
MTAMANEDADTGERCYICRRSANEIGKLMGVKSVEGYEFRTLYIKEGGGLYDSKVVDHKLVNLCDYERKAVNHMKIDVVVCPICKTLINALAPRQTQVNEKTIKK